MKKLKSVIAKNLIILFDIISSCMMDDYDNDEYNYDEPMYMDDDVPGSLVETYSIDFPYVVR